MTPAGTRTTRPALGTGVLAAACGGALGALARWAMTAACPVPYDGFPSVTFAINVSGSAMLAALPMLALVRRTTWLPVFLGTGVLGGFTTMSAASVETFALLDLGEPALAATYCLGTVAAAVGAVGLIDRATTAEERAEFEQREGDE